MARVRLSVENREGILYISSKDVPGLWLWGNNPEELFSNVIPTIEELYKYNKGLIVRVEEARPSGLARWFQADKVRDEFNVYFVAQASHHHADGRSTVE